MSQGLPVSNLVSVQIQLGPSAAQGLNLGSAVIIGDSGVIDTQTRIRSYTSLAAIAVDYGTTAPEYLAAALWFGQTPQPDQLYLGEWAAAATAGILLGAPLTAAQQALANFTGLTSSGFKIQVDGAGSPVAVTVGTLAGITNMNGIATAINAGLVSASVGAVCSWNATYSYFQIVSNTTGTTSKVKPLTAPASGTDLSLLIGLTAAAGAREVDGIAAEQPVAAITAIDALSTFVYGVAYASTAAITAAQALAVAEYCQAATLPHLFGAHTEDVNAINAASTADIGYLMSNAALTRGFAQYSSLTHYSSVSALARLLTTNLAGSNTAITLAFKQEPGVQAETLTPSQQAALDAKRYIYFVNYNNGTKIIENGWCSGPAYIDDIFNLDVFANNLQTALFNALYQTTTKIPQTDQGTNTLANVAEGIGSQFVTNGVLAPGIWTGPPIGGIVTGQPLPKGYYIYMPPVATQSAADRGARKSPVLQVCVILAGAVQSVSCVVNVQR